MNKLLKAFAVWAGWTICAQAEISRPNVLWVIVEDTQDWMSCYGDPVVITSCIDALAKRGVQFDRAYATAAVCSPARSALATGMYQTSIGAHNHISSRPNPDPKLWEPNYIGVKTIPELFRQAGYYTFSEGSRKDDYNFIWSAETLYDHHNWEFGFKGAVGGSDWSGCPAGTPFFGTIQLMGGKHVDIEKTVEPSRVSVPPYYPDHPVIRECIAHHYDTILQTDRELGQIVQKLQDDGLYDNTVIFFFSDHGMELLRHKQFLYEGGIRVPLIISGPKIPTDTVRKDLVSCIDIGPTSMSLAGIPVPAHMQGADLFAEDFHRAYVAAARDRAGIAIDRIRSITTDRYKFIRNFMTDRPWMQPQYRDSKAYTKVMKDLFVQGKLNDVQARFMADSRPAEEFYDLQNDPHEIHNLVHDPGYAAELARHRMLLANWVIETDDQGHFPESLKELRGVLHRSGDRCVNPEYDAVRSAQ